MLKESTGGTVRDGAVLGELHQKTRVLAVFISVSELLASVRDVSDLDAALGTTIDKILELMGRDVGGILLLDEDTRRLAYRVCRGMSGDRISRMRLTLGEGVSGRVAETGEKVLSEDVSADPRAAPPDFGGSDGLRAFASIPLRSKGKVLGVLNISGYNCCPFSREDLHLLEGIAWQVATAIENARLRRQILSKSKVHRELLREMLAIQEEERRRIARELHDETSQVLSSLNTNLEVALGMLPAGTNEVRLVLKKAQALSTSILEGTLKLIYQLRPTLLDDLGLVAAVRWFIDSTLEAAGIAVDFKVSGKERRLPAKVETEIFRVVQEIVANIIHHARAGSVKVRIYFKRGKIVIFISDDGCGFDIAEVIVSKEYPRGLGLLGMQERVHLINGTIRILSHPNSGGTKVDIEVPSGKRRD